MQNNCYYEINNVPQNFLRSDMNMSAYPDFKDHNWSVWNENAESYLTSDAMQFLLSLGIVPSTFYGETKHENSIVVFKGEPDRFMDIHCDKGPTWALNFVFGSSSSEMIWYRDGGATTTTEICSIGSPYQKYDPAKCLPLDRAKCNGLFLCRIDIPHNVINYDLKNERWCVSIRDMGSKLSWEQAVERFSNVVKNRS